MNDDFRVTLTLDGEGLLGELLEGLRADSVRRELESSFGERVVVSHDAERLFVYAASEEDARAAAAAVAPFAERHDLRVMSTGPLERWHPEEERWEDASVPLPATQAEHEVERARRRRHEELHSEQVGTPEWEVLVKLRSERAAREWAEQLQAAGLAVVRRNRFVMAGAPSEDEARALAERLEADAPPGSSLEVTGNGQGWWSALHPFAVFGGLGG